MRLIRWGRPGEERPGMLDANDRPRDLTGYISDLDSATLGSGRMRELARLDAMALPEVDPAARLGPCIGRVGHFVAVGLNYLDHAREAGMPVPEQPILFSKAPSCIGGAGDDIVLPPGSSKTDWEVELAVVISRPAYRVSAARALDHVAGFCICNDLSEREYQLERGGQWLKGKSFPGFGPLGPWLVTPDEIADVHALSMWLDVNGQRRQTGSTREMIFRVPELISYISHVMLLNPADVITTGTPPGVGMGAKPPTFLHDGDRLRCGIEGLGVQMQVCRRAPADVEANG
jgi:2,4-didehydro-3-deoxy-L-rhamnonate hydrolase